MSLSLSVIVPALNEEGNLEATVRAVTAALGERFSPWEVLIFDDGSRDGTVEIADALAARDSQVRAIHNSTTRGLGYSYWTGVGLARYEYVVLIPGDNEFPQESISRLLCWVGTAEIVVPHTANFRSRPWSRRLVSWGFTATLNLLFGLRLRYYNGTVVHRRENLLGLPPPAHGFAYQAEALVRLVKAGHSYIEVGTPIQKREHGSSKLFAWRNLLSVARALFHLFLEVRVWERNKYQRGAYPALPPRATR